MQLIEALSVRAPSADKKLKLLKEIAEEHELDWNPEASETELFKSHEDLLVRNLHHFLGLPPFFLFLNLLYYSLSAWPYSVVQRFKLVSS